MRRDAFFMARGPLALPGGATGATEPERGESVTGAGWTTGCNPPTCDSGGDVGFFGGTVSTGPGPVVTEGETETEGFVDGFDEVPEVTPVFGVTVEPGAGFDGVVAVGDAGEVGVGFEADGGTPSEPDGGVQPQSPVSSRVMSRKSTPPAAKR